MKTVDVSGDLSDVVLYPCHGRNVPSSQCPHLCSTSAACESTPSPPGPPCMDWNNSKWLNDNVINLYMELINDRSRAKGAKVHALNTFIYVRLRDRGIKAALDYIKVDLKDIDIVNAPVHLGTHWCLAVMRRKDTIIEYYDSFKGSNPKCMKLLLEMLADACRDNTILSWDRVHVKDSHDQENGADCVTFASVTAERLSTGAKLTFSQEDMVALRKKMPDELLNNKLMDW